MSKQSIYSDEERRARRKAYAQVWNAANKEKRNAYSRAWRAAHKELVATKHKEYAAANRKRINANERARRAKNKENIKKDRTAYYALNKERLLPKRKEYRARYREHIKAYTKVYRDNPQYKEKAVARTVAWGKKNPERKIWHENRRRTLKLGADGSHTLDEWLALKDRCGHKCACCGGAKKLTRDHIVPLSRGGSDWIENIQPLCKSCNSSKRDRHAINFMLDKSPPHVNFV